MEYEIMGWLLAFVAEGPFVWPLSQLWKVALRSQITYLAIPNRWFHFSTVKDSINTSSR